jgi:tetratricopeptide (TPR) repeat protein
MNGETRDEWESLTGEIGRRYYRIALGAAERRDLSAACAWAEYALFLDTGLEDAAALLEICRRERGDPGGGGAADQPGDGLEEIRCLAGQKKYAAAVRAAGRLPQQSVRTLNIRGCLFAAAGRYGRAADCFTRALIRDRGNRLAADALAELSRRRKPFWKLLQKDTERITMRRWKSARPRILPG